MASIIVSETLTMGRTMGQTFAMPDEVVNKTMRMHWQQISKLHHDNNNTD